MKYVRQRLTRGVGGGEMEGGTYHLTLDNAARAIIISRADLLGASLDCAAIVSALFSNSRDEKKKKGKK